MLGRFSDFVSEIVDSGSLIGFTFSFTIFFSSGRLVFLVIGGIEYRGRLRVF